MRNLVTTPLMFQQMALKVTASMMSTFMEMNLHLLEQQVALFDKMQVDLRRNDSGSATVHPKAGKPRAPNPTAMKRTPHMRKAGKHPSPCCGPDLLDHYGKRAHVVDVEHI